MTQQKEEIRKADILFEDNHLIAINKRAGQLSQPDNDGNPGLEYYIKQYIARKYNKPGEVFLGSIHRLDQPTTGVIIFARTSLFFKFLSICCVPPFFAHCGIIVDN